ncbi:MAG: calcium/proton exchanger [Bryobacteraceae bacterium]
MIISFLLVLVPVSWILGFGIHASPLWIFATSGLSIVPVADRMRRATEQLAKRTGPAIGGLVTVAFGSFAELILALFVLNHGDTEVVKAQITGSIIGTSLLGLGVALIAGGLKRKKQTFDRESAGSLGSLLILSVVALLLPALFDFTERRMLSAPNPAALDEKLSISVSVVLILVYVANLIYTLVTHRDVFKSQEEKDGSTWSVWKTIAVLVGGTAIVAVEADLVSGSLQATSAQLELSSLFLGVIVLSVIGNAADIIAAVYFATQDRMGLVIGLCLGSSVQVAMVLAPALVLISYFMGHPMNLIFSNPLDLIAIVATVFAVRSIVADGETNWFEGVLLVAVYVLIAMAFFFSTAGSNN